MKKFFKNTMYSLFGKAVGMFSLMILDIFLARSLPAEYYAEWAFFFSVLTILFFVGWLGINSSSKVYISRYRDHRQQTECIKSALFLRFVLSLVVSCGIAVAMPGIMKVQNFSDKYPDLKALFIYSGFLVFFNSFTEFYKEIFVGLGWFKRLFVLTITEYLGYLCFTIFFSVRANSVLSVALGYLLAGILVFVTGFCFVCREYDLFNTLQSTSRFHYVRPIAKYAIPMFLIGIGVVILIEIDTFMLGIFSDKHQLAIYNIAKNLNAKLCHVNYSVAVGTMTTFAVIDQNTVDKQRSQFQKINLINLLLTAGIAAVIFLCTPFFVKILYGAAYADAGFITRALIPYYVLYSLSTFFATFLDFRGKAGVRSLAYIGIILLDIFFNYQLIPRYGALGAAIATSLSLFPYAVIMIIMSFHEWGIYKRQKKELGDSL